MPEGLVVGRFRLVQVLEASGREREIEEAFPREKPERPD
jgi:hypothetical protein